jgi:hypothetical protein
MRMRLSCRAALLDVALSVFMLFRSSVFIRVLVNQGKVAPFYPLWPEMSTSSLPLSVGDDTMPAVLDIEC